MSSSGQLIVAVNAYIERTPERATPMGRCVSALALPGLHLLTQATRLLLRGFAAVCRHYHSWFLNSLYNKLTDHLRHLRGWDWMTDSGGRMAGCWAGICWMAAVSLLSQWYLWLSNTLLWKMTCWSFDYDLRYSRYQGDCATYCLYYYCNPNPSTQNKQSQTDFCHQYKVTLRGKKLQIL